MDELKDEPILFHDQDADEVYDLNAKLSTKVAERRSERMRVTRSTRSC